MGQTQDLSSLPALFCEEPSAAAHTTHPFTTTPLAQDVSHNVHLHPLHRWYAAVGARGHLGGASMYARGRARGARPAPLRLVHPHVARPATGRYPNPMTPRPVAGRTACTHPAKIKATSSVTAFCDTPAALYARRSCPRRSCSARARWLACCSLPLLRPTCGDAEGAAHGSAARKPTDASTSKAPPVPVPVPAPVPRATGIFRAQSRPVSPGSTDGGLQGSCGRSANTNGVPLSAHSLWWR